MPVRYYHQEWSVKRPFTRTIMDGSFLTTSCVRGNSEEIGRKDQEWGLCGTPPIGSVCFIAPSRCIA
jgi:hypothetical protein